MKYIELTKGYKAIVDDADFVWLSKFKWHAYSNHEGIVYAVRNNTRKKISKGVSTRMNRIILGLTGRKVAEHINGNSLDNRRCNLRIATQQQNLLNRGSAKDSSSEYKGVYWHKAAKKWCAEVRNNFKRFYLGLFESETAAARAYNEKAKLLHGEFARLNPV